MTEITQLLTRYVQKAAQFNANSAAKGLNRKVEYSIENGLLKKVYTNGNWTRTKYFNGAAENGANIVDHTVEYTYPTTVIGKSGKTVPVTGLGETVGKPITSAVRTLKRNDYTEISRNGETEAVIPHEKPTRGFDFVTGYTTGGYYSTEHAVSEHVEKVSDFTRTTTTYIPFKGAEERPQWDYLYRDGKTYWGTIDGAVLAKGEIKSFFRNIAINLNNLIDRN